MTDTTMASPTLVLASVPAFAAALRTMTPTHFALCQPWQTPSELVPMYRISRPNGNGEVEAASRVIGEVIERMRRLNAAYGEWQQFDIPAYFDLTVAQAACLVRIRERVSTVHIIFYADLLLPSFQQLLHYWSQTFVPAYQQMDRHAEDYQAFLTEVQPHLVEQWLTMLGMITQCRRLLWEDVSFLAASGAQEERARWRQWWAQPPVPGLDPRLTLELGQLPTLTLSLDFPLPAHRQPHRLRRLRQNRERRRIERRRRR
ncbi:MAG: hypothetical protein KF832_28115 [Caldilineaceae bacterium]|nr:hypothetical protein [Caldilineaceae bacterium]